jgi:hypothetical protein
MMRRRLLAALALTVLIGLPSVLSPQPAQASTCTGWPSTRVPPTTIRVLRTGTHKVQVVDFKSYVNVVMAAEWPYSWEAEALKAGAMAVKQYGWYYAMHWRGGSGTGGCYDVVDSTNDQLYQPETRTVQASIRAAVDATWSLSATKSGSFLIMGYRSGASVACGADYDGYHLYQHSVRACAQSGLKMEQILHVYFDPGLAVWGPPALPTAIFFTPADGAAVTVGTSAAISWAEGPAAGKTIASRRLSLVMAQPFNGSCAVDRWLPASPAVQVTGGSPQTVTGLKTGMCYKALLSLTDSAAAKTTWQSGTMLVDPAAAVATFTSPAPTAVTALTGTTWTVRWTETPASGTHIVSRMLATERSFQAAAGTCTGGAWSGLTSTTAASPVSSSGPGRLGCYRYRLVLTDSAGHKSTTISGVLMGTPS